MGQIFLGKKNFGRKIFWVKKIWDGNFVGSKKIKLDQKKCGLEIILGPKEIGSEIFLSQKKFGSEIFLGKK